MADKVHIDSGGLSASLDDIKILENSDGVYLPKNDGLSDTRQDFAETIKRLDSYHSFEVASIGGGSSNLALI